MIRRTSFLFLLAFQAVILFGQELDYTIILWDEQKKPMVGTEITLTETETREILRQTTDASGTVKFYITSGKLWQIDILQIKNYFMWQIEMPEGGRAMEQRMLTYSYNRYLIDMQPPVDRMLMKIENIVQTIKSTEKPTREEAIVKVVMKRPDGKALPNYPVKLFNASTSKTYEAKGSSMGIAYLKVPTGYQYKLDVADVENYEHVDISEKVASIYTKNVSFEPANFTETIVDNIVTQKLPPIPAPTSGRYFLQVLFLNGNKEPLSNTPVKLKEIEGEKQYQTTTSDQGIAYFMLPKGKTYVYVVRELAGLEDYIKVADLTRAFGIGGGKRRVQLSDDMEPIVTKLKLFRPMLTEDLIEFFAKNDIKILSFKNKSIPLYIKSYLCFEEPDKTLDIDKGFLLTNGSVFNALGPNDQTGASMGNCPYKAENIPASLKRHKLPAYDVCILELEIETMKPDLVLKYSFASEEYQEYLDFDDGIGIFIKAAGISDTVNQAVIDKKDIISVATVNQKKNTSSFLENDKEGSQLFNTWQYDGFTKTQFSRFKGEVGKKYTISLHIFDRGDNVYDSGFFIDIYSE